MYGLLGISPDGESEPLPVPLLPGDPLRCSPDDPNIRLFNPEWHFGPSHATNAQYIDTVVQVIIRDTSVRHPKQQNLQKWVILMCRTVSIQAHLSDLGRCCPTDRGAVLYNTA